MEENKNSVFTITEEMFTEKARTYVPIAEKQSFVDEVVVRCFDPISISGADGADIPPVYKENIGRRMRYLAGGLAKLYLGEGFATENDDDPWMMTDEAYDYFWGGRPISQIERLRRFSKNKALQDQCYDLMQDYKELTNMLNSEIHGLMRAMNDTLSRFQMLIEAQTTPEYFQSLTKNLEEVQQELAEYAANRNITQPDGDSEAND